MKAAATFTLIVAEQLLYKIFEGGVLGLGEVRYSCVGGYAAAEQELAERVGRDFPLPQTDLTF